MFVTVKQFRQRLVASGLMSDEEVGAFLDKLPENCRPTDGKALARALVNASILTSYQAGMVHQGKIKALVLGDYALLDRLGQGGMGMVFEARHKHMKRTVALKILPPSATKTPTMVKRFAREVEAAANLVHPNIVMAYDAGEALGVHFLVMQLINGKDLGRLVREKGPLPVGAAVDCVCQAAAGLEYAHDRCVIHRDIKPSNLLLDEEGTVKVLDLGLARIVEKSPAASEQDELTQTGVAFGTVDFMAPEQAEDTKQADERSDIYSLGCTLYYLLTGTSLYPGGTVIQKVLAHAQRPIPSLREMRPGVSQELDALFAKMVAKRSQDRQQSMAEVIAGLEKYQGGGQTTTVTTLAGSTGQSERLHWLDAATSDREDDLQAWLKSESPAADGNAPHIDTAELAETVDQQPMQGTRIKHGAKRQQLPEGPDGKRRQTTVVIATGAAGGIVVLALLVALLWPEPTLEVASVNPAKDPISTTSGDVATVSRASPPQKVLRPAESTPAGNATQADEQQTDEPKTGTAMAPTPEVPEPTVVTNEQEPAKEVPWPPATEPAVSTVTPQKKSEEARATSLQRTEPVQAKKPALAQEPVAARTPEPPKPKISLSGDDLDQARQEVSKLLTAEIRQAKEPDAKAALAKRLLDGDCSDNSARQYAMLDQARELAIKAGDVTSALAATGKMTKTFQLDEPLELDTLEALNRYVRASSDQREYLQAIVEFVHRAVQEGRFAEGWQLIERADSVARKCCGKVWQKRVAAARGELEVIAEERKRLQDRFASLQDNPEDRQCNLAVGQFWCFFVLDWERGLPLLAKSSEELLAELAEIDLAMAEGAAASELAGIAQRWWELAKKTKVDAVASACRSRAGHWYAKAEPGLSGVRKLEATKRTDSAATQRGILSLLNDCEPPV